MWSSKVNSISIGVKKTSSPSVSDPDMEEFLLLLRSLLKRDIDEALECGLISEK